MKVIKHYDPTFFSREEDLQVGKSIIIEEVESVQSKFAKDKIPGPNGWIIEFSLKFLDLLGPELV